VGCSLVLDDIRMPFELVSILALIIIPLLVLLLMRVIDIVMGWIIAFILNPKSLILTFLTSHEKDSEFRDNKHTAP
jgi:hypothetical protein